MRILLIGGTGFIGSFLAPELQRQGAEVATLTRGRSPIAHADGLTRIIGDRKRLRDALSSIRAFAPDVVVDLVLSSGTQARELMSVLHGATGRVVAISSIDVYRACGILHGLEDGPPPGGLDFPGGHPPEYTDFLYFSFIIGVANQTADVDISGRKIRRIALLHGLIAFLFNTVILAATINVAAGLG